VVESLRSAIQSQHPAIAHEIEGAINTLRKLQEIAGPPGAARPPGPDAGEPSAVATSAGSLAPPAAESTDPMRATADAGAPAARRPVPVLAAGDTFGRYQVVRQLGRGAMGAVYLAYDCQLQRHVALKTPVLSGGSRGFDRFFREARAAAQIRSPYVCPVFDAGQIGDVHYLSMAFIDGQPLSRAIAERRLGDAAAVARVTQKIARGMQKAHEHGIIHRDLKPDNIMLDADGEPIVMDFGLARRLDDDIRLTAPGSILGTPAYMSPEQVDGNPDQVGSATDVYSLGVVLFEMLTGRVPFRGSFASVLRQVVSDQPPRPSSVNPALGRASPLERICLTMMAKAAADRYPSMARVVEALDEAFPREPPPPAAGRSLWQRLVSSAGRLFASRSGVPAPAGPSPDRALSSSGSRTAAVSKDQPPAVALASSGSRTAALSKDRLSGDQTVERSPDGVASSGSRTAAVSEDRLTGDQTVDLPPSHG
jgi:serine/threonine protein kinase